MVGDAGHFADPLTGGGIFPAMVSGQLAAQSAINVLNGMDDGEAARLYDVRWQQQLGPSLRKAHLVQKYMGARPCAINVLVTTGLAIPFLKKRMLRSLAGQHT